MRAITRKHSANGAYLESSNTLNIGHVVSASSKLPQILSLQVDGASVVSGISLEIVSSQNAALSQGFLKYYTSKDIITSFDNIVVETASLNSKIPLRNSGSTTSEYVYIWIDQSKISYRGDASIRFKWNFDYIEPSSSSSSSSSCALGAFVGIGPYEDVTVNAEDCESVYMKFDLDVGEYTTVFFDGEALSFENNGGNMVVCDEIFFEDDTTNIINVDGVDYTVTMIDSASFFMSIYRSGDCSPFDHLILTTGDDFLFEDGFRVLLLGDGYYIKARLVQTSGFDFMLVGGGRLILVNDSSSSCSSSSSSV